MVFMGLLELLYSREFIGRDFLTWLWFKSETNENRFAPGGCDPFEMWVDDRLVLESEGEEKVQQVICQGEDSELTEARHALLEGKKVVQAKMRLFQGDNEWVFTLDAAWLNFRSLKTPKVMGDVQEDPAGLFFERLLLIRKAIDALEAVFMEFLELRLSPKWSAEELPAFRTWLNQSLGR
jgi:recombination associated protein RdgC